jgi:hypothetical protein
MSHEENVSTEPKKKSQDPWLSGANEDGRWSQYHQAAQGCR